MNLNEMQTEIHATAKEKGWWDRPREVPELLCLVHAEVSEALEKYRVGDPIDYELADIIIRVLDMAEFYGLNMQTLVENKMSFNKLREYRHGGKIA